LFLIFAFYGIFAATPSRILRRDLFFRKFCRLALLELDRCNLPKMMLFAELFYAKAIVAFFFGWIAM